MLIILPPSESKRLAPEAGRPLDMESLSFLELNPMRERIIDALVETSGSPDAFDRLRVGPSLVAEVIGNTVLRESPALPAIELYSGPLYDGLQFATLSYDAKERAARRLVIASALWGALRPADEIPTYRLHVCSRLAGIDRLEPTWRKVLPAVLAEAAGPEGVVVDLRSPTYQAIGMPARMGERTMTVRVLPEAAARTIGDVVAKRIRGQVARHLLESGVEPQDPDELTAVLSEHWPVRLDEPSGPTRPWTIRLRPRD